MSNLNNINSDIFNTNNSIFSTTTTTTMNTSSSTNPLHDPKYYSDLYPNLERYFLSWYLPFVLTVGTIGGLFCLTFLCLSRLFPRNILIWMICICVGDLLVLYFDSLRMTIKVLSPGGFDLRDTSTFMCRMHLFVSNYFLYWSGYMQACMSLQRLYFVLRPLRARMVLKTKMVVSTIVVVSILLIIPFYPYLLYWDLYQNLKGEIDCEPSDNNYYTLTSVFDAVFWGIIPLASMTLSTTLIAAKILHFSPRMKTNNKSTSNNKNNNNNISNSNNNNNKTATTTTTTGGDNQNNLQLNQRTGGTTSTSGTGTAIVSSSSAASTTPVVRRAIKATVPGQRHGQDNAGHVTRLLVVINAFYMLTTYPLLAYVCILNFALPPIGDKEGDFPQKLHKFIYYFLRSLCYLNSSFNWVFYCAAGKIFRRRAIRVLRRIFCRSHVDSFTREISGRSMYAPGMNNTHHGTTTAGGGGGRNQQSHGNDYARSTHLFNNKLSQSPAPGNNLHSSSTSTGTKLHHVTLNQHDLHQTAESNEDLEMKDKLEEATPV